MTRDGGKGEQLDFYRGMPPHVATSDTSRKAAEEIAADAHSIRADVYRYIQAQPGGATDDEIEVALGLRHQTASARRRELVLHGLIRDSGERRPTRSGRAAAVWRLL